MRGVASNPRQRQKFVDLARTAPSMVPRNLAGGRMQIPDATVIAEAFPRLQHFRLGGRGKRMKIRKAAEPAFIVRNDSRHLRLLEHEFRNENGVRVPRSP